MPDCENCPSRDGCKSQDSCGIRNNPNNHIGKVVGVMSGKGGVGKSTVSVLIAKELRSRGFAVGILDADITGPSIPRLLGLAGKRAGQSDFGVLPAESGDGISVMSINLLLSDESQPVIWRGPLVSATVKQFWEEVYWGVLDYLIIDMPPGTGDVALTAMQSIPINGMLIVSVPQDMVSMIVAKAVNMVKELKIKLIGAVENMSYVPCPKCGESIRIFEGDSVGFYKSLGLELLGSLPMTGEIAAVSGAKPVLSEKINSEIASITDKIISNLK